MALVLLNIALDFGATQNNGNLQGQTIKRGSQTWSQSYPTTCYDGVNRLTCASESGAGTWSQTYGYDAFGNRWVNGTGLPSQSNQVPAGNWYLLGNSTTNRVVHSPHGNGLWTYDDAGNLKAMTGMPGWGFTYDAENRQITADTTNGPTTTYAYDGEGRRVSKTWNGQTTRFVYDAFGNLAAEYNETAAVTATQYLTTDHLGSTRLITNSSGAVVKCYDYLPFGEEIGTTAGRPSCFSSGSYPAAGGASNTEFTGQLRDSETGWDYFGARYMSAAQGRFTSADAPFADQPVENPQSWNMYAYVRNNPLRMVDPTGGQATDAGVYAQLYVQRKITKQQMDAYVAAESRGTLLGAAIVFGGGILAEARALATGIATWALSHSQQIQDAAAGIAEGLSGAAPGSLTGSKITSALRSSDFAKQMEGKVGQALANSGLLQGFDVTVGGRQIDALAGKGGQYIVEVTTGSGKGKIAQALAQMNDTGKTAVIYGENLTKGFVKEAQRQGIRVAQNLDELKRIVGGQ